MKTMKLFNALALVTMVFAGIQANAQNSADPNMSAAEELAHARRDIKTNIVSFTVSNPATRMAERMIVRSDTNLYRGQTTTIATVTGDGVTYLPGSEDLRKLSSFSERTLMYLARFGECDFNDSACIAFEDKKDSAYRLSTRRRSDGTVEVLIANMMNFSSVPLKEMIRTVDRNEKPKSVIFTRANGANY